MNTMPVRLLTAIFALLLARSAECATFDVTDATGFQTALTQAQANGQNDTINVAAGTYNLGSTLTYSADENYSLSVAGASSSTTLLDGGGTRQCLTLTNNGSGAISVSGITCRNGRAANLGGGLAINTNNGAISLLNCEIRDNVSARSAGGAYLGGLNGDIRVANCVVDGNSVDPVTGDDGGGLDIYVDVGGTADISLLNSTITNNSVGECPSAVGSPDGAGVFMYHLGSGSTITVSSNTISNNTALGGPAGLYLRATLDANLVFNGNTLSGNNAGRTAVGASGGGAHVQLERGTAAITNNLFLDNRAIGPYANGGGFDFEVSATGSCRLLNNVFAGNSAQQHGGGLSLNAGPGLTQAIVAGNLFVNNQAGTTDGSGGGLILNAECDVTMANNTFHGNSAAGAGGLGFYSEGAGNALSIANDMYRGNTPDAIGNLGVGTIAATYSNIQGGSGQPYFGAGCIDAAPLFFNATNPPGADGVYATVDDGLHLTALSPSSNTGSTAAVPPSLLTDLAGQLRVQGGAVDMGAYEGQASTPTTHSITLAVSPSGGGTTIPAAGAHSLSSPTIITAVPADGYSFAGWTVTDGLTAAAPGSLATTLTFDRDGTATANFTATTTHSITLAVSPSGGGTTIPAAGAHSLSSPTIITAVPADGYSFAGWTVTDGLTAAAPGSLATTLTFDRDGTATANFTPEGGANNLLFIHHSCGANWLASDNGGLQTALEAKDYIDEVNEITYGDAVTPDVGRPASLGDIAGDSTDMNSWLFWFNDYLGSVQTYRCDSGSNGVIMFKSCFPNSHVDEVGALPGDPFDAAHSVVNHQAVFRNAAGPGVPYSNGGYNYHALEDVFAAHPDTLFIYVTSPPECYADATPTTGDNARTFNDWLKTTWLPSYNALHPGLNNVVIFDWFDFLANPDTGSAHANMLKADNGGTSGDSHPNTAANQASTTLFASGAPNFLDLVHARFAGTASTYALTLASSPAPGGVTVPVSGTANAYAPLVLSATAATGYQFVGWTISANGRGYNTESPTTTLLMGSATTATAVFSPLPYMTLGSITNVGVANLTGFEGVAFGGKPSPSVTFIDPLSGATRSASLKATFNKATPTAFVAEWTKKQPLFNKRNIPTGTNSATYLAENPLVELICAFNVKASGLTAEGAKIKSATYGAGQLFLTPPEITGVQDAAGNPLTTASLGATVYVVGNYFGTKAPAVWFESDSNGRIKQTKCKVQKSLFSPTYPDAKGKPSCMNCMTGASMVPVTLPTKMPSGGFLGFIALDNGVGRDTFALTVQ